MEAGARSVPGVRSAAASAVTGLLKVLHDGRVDADEVARAVEAAGYRARPVRAGSVFAVTSSLAGPPRSRPADGRVAAGARELRRRATLAATSGVLLALAFGARFLAPPSSAAAAVAAPLFLAAAAAGGWLVAGQAFASLRNRMVNFEVLVIVAAAGAIGLGDLPEAALVLFLFAVGETLEAGGVSRTRRAISSLLDLVPRTALVRRNGSEVEVPAGEVAVGETVIVRPGERLPVDGRVARGGSFVDQAPVTGESLPVRKGPGDEVFAGTVNGSGALEVVSTRRPDDTTLARTVHLVEEAQLVKARSQRIVDRFAEIYTPLVVGLAVAIAVLPPLILRAPFEPYIYRALVLLLVACPCALVLSTPVAVVSAIGRAARSGVLVKGGAALEAAGRLRAIAFDKTGTLTVGRPEVSDVIPVQGLSASRLLELAAAVEAHSEHPLAGAIRRRAGEGGETVARNYEAIPGRGAKARVEGRNHYVGSEALFVRHLGLPLGALGEVGAALEKEGKTVVYVGNNGGLLGLIAVSDTLRPEAHRAVADLRRSGVKSIYLLTGDNPETAGAVARALELDGYRAGLLPADKVEAVRALEAVSGPLGMVGDGINDAPALAAATVGLAMGAAGADQAVEAADIALMSDDLGRVAYTVRLGRRAVGVIRQNIALALGIKAAALVLAAAGLLPLWLAVVADTGNTVLVTLNGLRLLAGPR